MEQITIENLSFSYPLAEKQAIRSLSLHINSGEFILLCGKSGCGKTTLLKHLKKELTPHGKKSGKIFFNGKNTDEMSLRESAEHLGFVMQNPDLQIVTDKVWHELAFGLENLGLDKNEIRLRTAEMASYFGLGELFNEKTTTLSGGQKQLLNLAGVTVMHPDVLLLDEPTSQLDPIAAENFLSVIGKINRELGITVIMTEQRLEEVFSYADRVLVMEEGQLVFDSTPRSIIDKIEVLPAFLQSAIPTAMRIFAKTGGTGVCPVTVREGREWLSHVRHQTETAYQTEKPCRNPAIELKDICFRYEKNGDDILKNLCLTVPEHSFFAVLGENGSGKSTLLKIIAGTLTPFSGKIKIYGEKQKKTDKKIILLPQQTEAVFTEKSVLLDLQTVQTDDKKINAVVKLTDIENILQQHPFDLSGGEQQRAGLAKALLHEPDILLLDEPTKGMDAAFKTAFAAIIRTVIENGCTVIMISHDVEFCARYTDICAMLFDCDITACADTHEFFCKNRFYTTAAGRMARNIIKNAVTDEDICRCIQKN